MYFFFFFFEILMACFNRVKEWRKLCSTNRSQSATCQVTFRGNLNMIQSRDERVQSLPQNVVFFVDIKQMEH